MGRMWFCSEGDVRFLPRIVHVIRGPAVPRALQTDSMIQAVPQPQVQPQPAAAVQAPPQAPPGFGPQVGPQPQAAPGFGLRAEAEQVLAVPVPVGQRREVAADEQTGSPLIRVLWAG